jgi:hypothetical protein
MIWCERKILPVGVKLDEQGRVRMKSNQPTPIVTEMQPVEFKLRTVDPGVNHGPFSTPLPREAHYPHVPSRHMPPSAVIRGS